MPLIRKKTQSRVRPSASIIVPCWNGLRYTRDCLESVRRWTRAPYELIVVDNGSTDGTSRFVSSLRDPRIRLIRNPVNRGFAGATNQGMEAARGELFVWLNNDVVVTPGWLDRLAACAEREASVGAVGPYSTAHQANGLQCLAGGPASGGRLEVFSDALAMRHAGQSSSVPYLFGFCLLVKKEAVRRAGALDERFELGGYEDVDFCLRLRLAGYELRLARDVYVHHHGRKTLESGGVDDLALVVRNRSFFVDKWLRQAREYGREIPALAKNRAGNGRLRVGQRR